MFLRTCATVFAFLQLVASVRSACQEGAVPLPANILDKSAQLPYQSPGTQRTMNLMYDVTGVPRGTAGYVSAKKNFKKKKKRNKRIIKHHYKAMRFAYTILSFANFSY